VAIAAVPLTHNGKLDDTALPASDERSFATAPHVEPRTRAERDLAALWSELLEVPQVGADDSFFALGGHSLLATQLVSRVRERLGKSLSLRAVFEAPTLAAQAAALEAAPAAELTAIPAIDGWGALRLSSAQERMWFLTRLEPVGAALHVAAVVQLRGALDVDAMRAALLAIAQRHEPLRTVIEDHRGLPRPRVLDLDDDRVLAFELDDAAADPDARVAALIAAPFDLERGPLLRAGILRTAPYRATAVLVTHHIAADGWSMGVIVRELCELYAAARARRPAQFAELPIQYLDYAAWQRVTLDDAALAPSLAYWARQLADLPTLDLPLDHPRAAVQRFEGARLSFAIPAML